MELDVFNVNLDSVSESEAAALAEKMLAIITLCSSRLNLGAPSDTGPSPVEPLPLSQPFQPPTQQPLMPEMHPSDMAIVKQEQSDLSDVPTFQPQVGEPPLLLAKEEPSVPTVTLTSDRWKESEEKEFILCGTSLTSSKKVPIWLEFFMSGTVIDAQVFYSSRCDWKLYRKHSRQRQLTISLRDARMLF